MMLLVGVVNSRSTQRSMTSTWNATWLRGVVWPIGFEMRQDDREAATLSCARLRTDVTSVGFRHTLDDRQAQPGAAPISVCLSVGGEDVGQRLGGQHHARSLYAALQSG